MRKESLQEGCSMNEHTSAAHSRRPSLKPRRKLPFEGENVSASRDSQEQQVKSNDSPKSAASHSTKDALTPRRNTPLSERQQIALLCKLTEELDSPVNECCAPSKESCLKRNERGETALHLAAIKGDYPRVHSLLKQGFNVNATDFAGWTPLHEACNHGWLKVAQLLLQFDADVNALGLDKCTPLHDAAANQHEEVVKLLVKHGADPHQENAYRRTPVDVAGSERIAQLLREALRSKEVGPEDKEPSPRQPISASCELTMRKNSPQNQTHKGAADKPTSPRFTLKFQTIRSSNDKSLGGCRPTDVTSPSPKYPSYCVTMETKEREDHLVSSTSTSSAQPPVAAADEAAVTSTTTCHRGGEDAAAAPDDAAAAAATPEKSPPAEKMDTSEVVVASKVNGGRSSLDAAPPAAPASGSSDQEKEEARRKRRKSNDGSQRPSKDLRSSPKGSNTPRKGQRGSQSSSDTESNPSDAEGGAGGGNGGDSTPHHSPKVPPLKIVLPSGASSLEQERSKVSSSNKPQLPYVVNADTTVDGATAEAAKQQQVSASTSSTNKDDSSSHPPEERSFQRVTRSSQRMQQALTVLGDPASGGLVSSSSSKKGEEGGESSNEEQANPPPSSASSDVHPRKRKLRQREAGVGEGSGSSSQNNAPSSSASSGGEDAQQQHQQLNSYQMFLNIRKQVDKRRKAMFVVQPKPPQGFKDYLLNRCSYVLEGNAASRLSVPMISPPQSLEGSIKELFVQQEKERYRLRLQHLIEREKLVLSVEQETLRVHGRAARALANQTVPLSACTILKDEEIYNVLEDDKDKNIRSRYNGRLFLSWLQDVDDKWKKIKELMLLRHHNEAESLHAVQKLDWEWKMKELNMCDMKTQPVIDDIFVPMVNVNDDFELLPSTSCCP